MSKPKEPKESPKKQDSTKNKKVRIRHQHFLGEFTIEEYLQKEADLIIAKMKR